MKHPTVKPTNLDETCTNEIKRCNECGGIVESEVNGNFEDWICQNCRIIIGGGKLVDPDTKSEQ